MSEDFDYEEDHYDPHDEDPLRFFDLIDLFDDFPESFEEEVED